METSPKQGIGKTAIAWLRQQLAVTPSAAPHPRMNWRSRGTLACVLIFFVAFGVRLLHWHDLRVEIGQETSNLTSLFKIYRKEVKRMTADGLLFPNKPIDPGDVTMLVHPPAYSFLVMAMYGTEDSHNRYLALRLLQVLFDSLSVVLVFLIAAELFPLALAITAALLAAISPHLAYYSLWLSPDSLVVVPIVLAVYLILRARRTTRLVPYLLAGALLGLACWFRSNPMLLAPLFAGIVFFTVERSRRWRSTLAIVFAMAAVISPITIRNYLVYHRFIPLTIVTGMNLVQGIAEFDTDKRFGMPLADADVAEKDVEWHQRPDYRSYLWYPDGIARDQYRFQRGLTIIKQNPAWFARVMLSRMALMLRYNDNRPQPIWVFQSTAPVLSAAPGFGHDITTEVTGQPVWQASSADLLATIEQRTVPVIASVEGSEWLRLRSREYVERMISLPVSVAEGTDYALTLAARIEQGSANFSVRAAASGNLLQGYSLAAPEEKEEKEAGVESEIVLVPVLFSSRNQNTVNIVISNTSEEANLNLVVKEARLFALGPTPYQWTKVPRSLLRAAQKNIFRTDVMRVLIALGILLLALARRSYALAILLAVPAYYLGTHAGFSTEYRYVLAIHYFLFIIVATCLYVIACGLKAGRMKISHRLRKRRAEALAEA